ncbi:hypothetical protein CK203_046520 [Vitis vinifera]|uniref:Retrotransposon gag domain-containing protein n=1 Tax=Vitis vinifera TaxID=29760 RepID=A0A438ILL9_VITVI|nr:hypothetical protein CK203_046520 [Vitis vinifera]
MDVSLESKSLPSVGYSRKSHLQTTSQRLARGKLVNLHGRRSLALPSVGPGTQEGLRNHFAATSYPRRAAKLASTLRFSTSSLRHISGNFRRKSTTLYKKAAKFSQQKDKAKIWLNSLRPRSIRTWTELQADFLKKFFPTHRTNGLRDKSPTSQHRNGEEASSANVKRGMYNLSEDMEMKAKVAAMARKIEEMELRKVHEVKLFQNLNNQPILAPYVSHLNIWWKNVPPFRQQEKCLGNKLT